MKKSLILLLLALFVFGCTADTEPTPPSETEDGKTFLDSVKGKELGVKGSITVALDGTLTTKYVSSPVPALRNEFSEDGTTFTYEEEDYTFDSLATNAAGDNLTTRAYYKEGLDYLGVQVDPTGVFVTDVAEKSSANVEFPETEEEIEMGTEKFVGEEVVVTP